MLIEQNHHPEQALQHDSRPRETEYGEKVVLNESRELYVPTPLDPNNLVTPEGTPYFLASLDRIHSLVDELEDSTDQPAWFLGVVRESLMTSLAKRCTQNSDALGRHVSSHEETEFDESFIKKYEKAKNGAATTQELMEVTAAPHGLRAVELAKLSHPLDWEATEEMDSAIYSAIDEFDKNAQYRDRSAKRRYKFQRAETEDGEVRAVVLARKRDVAFMKNSLLVVKRSSLVVRFDEDLKEGHETMKPYGAYIKEALVAANNEAPLEGEDRDEAYRRRMDDAIANIAPYIIEQQLAKKPADRPEWLAPTATSYYCKEVNREPLAFELPAQKAARESLGSAAVSSRSYNQDQ